jgi:hypothetical protein
MKQKFCKWNYIDGCTRNERMETTTESLDLEHKKAQRRICDRKVTGVVYGMLDTHS